MPSTDGGLEQTGSTELPPLSIQKIIESISILNDKLSGGAAEKAHSPQQTPAPSNQTGTKQDGSNSGGVSQGNSDEITNKHDGADSQETKNTAINNKGKDVRQENHVQSNKDVSKEKSDDESNEREKVLREMGKLCKELDYMIRSFQKLENFENSLREPLKTLEANVEDIINDLPLVKPDELPKQVPLNLRVLRNNITRVKILIPLQHQTASVNSEGNRALQTTVATKAAEDLPHLYNEDIFEKSYYFKEIEEKYKGLDLRQKLCLLCFAIFPENAVIKKRLLRFWWVGENLIPPKEGKDEMGIVTDTLNKYVEKGFIEPILKKNKLQPRSYKMNPIVRSCVIKFAKDEHFFNYDLEGKPTMDFSSCKKACMVKSEGAPVPWFSDYLKGKGTEAKPEEQRSEKLTEQGPEKPKEQVPEKTKEQRPEKRKEQGQEKRKEQEPEKLSADEVKLQMLFNFPDRDTLKNASQQFDKLQTLFNISKQFPALPTVWFSKMTGLKVLYLGKWETTAGRPRHIEVEDIFFLKGLKNMQNLRLLSLQGISGIAKLPSTLCKLENLRILDLRACHNLEKLPDRIGSLKKLTYLDLSECYLLDDMPKQMNQLSELEVLKGFVIGDGKNSCTLGDLSELNKLRKLSVNVNTKKFNIDDAGDALSKFQKLQKLRIAWGSGGLPGKEDSTQDSSSEPQSKTNRQVSSTAAKSSTAKENKGEDKGNRESSAGEAKSKTMKQEEDKKKQNAGATKPVALDSKVSEQDSRKLTGTGGLKRVANMVMAANKFGKGKKPQNLKGLQNLVKLDLQCFPRSKPPNWLVPTKMVSLKNLSIRGGRLGYLVHEGERKWDVDTLRLKFLVDFKINWKEIQERFPQLKYLEKVRSPRITFCPCDASGVWKRSSK